MLSFINKVKHIPQGIKRRILNSSAKNGHGLIKKELLLSDGEKKKVHENE